LYIHYSIIHFTLYITFSVFFEHYLFAVFAPLKCKKNFISISSQTVFSFTLYKTTIKILRLKDSQRFSKITTTNWKK